MQFARAMALLSAATALLVGACTTPEARPAPRAPGPAAEPSSASLTSPAPPPVVDAVARGGAFTVRFLDVGQGDAALVTTSDHHAMLVDAGPHEGAAHVDAALGLLQGETLDFVVLSHAHADHLGDLDRLTRTLRLRVWVDPGFERSRFKSYEETLAHLAERHIPRKIARRGDHLALGSFVGIEVLEPEEPLLHGTRSDVNANSVVLRIDHHATRGDTRFLFEGDAEQPTEKRLLADPGSLRADVLKVAHHGSRFASSDALLDAVHPRLAVISSGQGNDYGHPHAEALARLRKHGVEVTRTDLEGTVTVQSDDSGLSWRTERPVDPGLLRIPGRGRHAEAAP